MIRAALAATALLLAPAGLSAQDAEGDPIMQFESMDAQMNAAIAKAQATMPEFLERLDNPPAGATHFVFKFPLEGYAEGWNFGDPVRVPISDISDWGYVDRTGVAQGHYTVRVMIDHMEPAAAAETRRQYGWAD